MLNTGIGQDLCQISLTGIRAIMLLGLLIQAPRSLEEIREEFIKCQIMEEDNSYDILRIDLNTLKLMGCEISRADKRTNNKYVLLKHPFEIEITDEEFKLLKKVVNRIKETANLEQLAKYDGLFRKFAEQISDNDTKEKLIGLSPLKKYSKDLINTLRSDCKFKRTLVLNYKSPASKTADEKEIVAQELVFKNDKIYLYGFDNSKKESVTLNIKRILKIISRSNKDDVFNSTNIKITFKLTNFGVSGLTDNEKILSGNFEDGFIIEGNYHNDFVATQRILSFGPACTVYEPQDFKEHIIELLKKMKEIYNG